MEKLSLPVMDYKKIYNDVFSENNIGRKTAPKVLNAKSYPNEKRDYIFKRYKEYQELAPHFENLKESEGISKEFQEMLTYMFDHDALFGNVKEKVYCNYNNYYDKCPFCMMSEPRTLDHYLCKSSFPEYTLFPLNLVPCCSECNNKKRTMFLDPNGKRQFMHVYYDVQPEKPVLVFDYAFEKDQITTWFIVDESIEGEEYDLFRKQFIILDLAQRMNHYLSTRITYIFKSLCREYRTKGKNECFRLVEGQLCTAEEVYGVNHYESAILRSILADRTKFEKLISHADWLF